MLSQVTGEKVWWQVKESSINKEPRGSQRAEADRECDLVTFIYCCLLFSQRKLNPGKRLLLPADFLWPHIEKKEVEKDGLASRQDVTVQMGIWLTIIFSTFNMVVLPSCLRNTTRTSVHRAHSCLVARSSALPSPERSYVTPRSCS